MPVTDPDVQIKDGFATTGPLLKELAETKLLVLPREHPRRYPSVDAR